MRNPSKKPTETAATIQTFVYAREITAPPRSPSEVAPTDYHAKFASLIKLVENAQREARKAPGVLNVVVVAFPEVLGDTYEEMVTSLTLIRVAGLFLTIVPVGG